MRILNSPNFKMILVIVILGFIVFGIGLKNNFLGDDDAQIVNNPGVHSYLNVLTFFKASTFYNGGSLVGDYYKPLMMLTYTVLYNTFGPYPFSFHLLQLLFHILNSILLLLLLKYFFKDSIAFILSLVFLVHPINSENVYYIAALQEVLFFFFGISALLCVLKFKSKLSLIPVAILLMLSLLSKESGILFVLVSLIIVFLYDRKRFIWQILSSSSVSLIYFFMKYKAVGLLPHSDVVPIDRLNLIERIMNIPAIIFFYFKTFIYPLNLSFGYAWVVKDINFLNFFLPLFLVLLTIAAIIFFGLKIYRSKEPAQFKVFLLFNSFILLGLLLHLQIFPLDLTVSERWFYFPLIGVLGLIGLLLETFKVDLKNKYFLILVATILVLLSARTLIRGLDWRDQLYLSNQDLKFNKSNYFAEHYIAYDFLKQRKLDEAKIHIDRSVEIHPYFTNLNVLAIVEMNQGRFQEAKQALDEGLKYGDYIPLYENIFAVTMLDPNTDKKSLEENIKTIKSGLKKFPNTPNLWLYLAILDYRATHIEEAKVAISNALKLSKTNETYQYYSDLINTNKPLGEIRINTIPN